MTNDRDIRYLNRAIELAERARATGNPPFGSLIVTTDDRILGEAWNTTVTDDDITAHPELKLARFAAREFAVEDAREITLYTSCEPCPMCASVIGGANLKRVVFALSAGQLTTLRPSGYRSPSSSNVIYDGPVLFSEARAPIDRFYGRDVEIPVVVSTDRA